MRNDQRPINDPEILELLQDEPELLAIADALAATRVRRPRHRAPYRALAAAAFLALATIGASISYVLLTDEVPSLSERALAAIGRGRVIHVISQRSESNRLLVDLRANRTRQVVTRTETWFDSRVGTLRTRTRREGTTVADALGRVGVAENQRAQELGSLAVATFARGYRRALQSGSAILAGKGRINGVPVGWIEFPVGQKAMEVAVIEPTGAPIAFRFVDDKAGDIWRISSLDSREHLNADFAAEQTARHASSGQVASETLLQLFRPPTLDGRPVWAGRTLVGLDLRTAVLQTLTRVPSQRRQPTKGLKLVYRGESDLFIEVLQARRAEPAYGYSDDHLTLGLIPIPNGNELALVPADKGRRVWVGQFKAMGIYTTIRGSGRDIVIKAARVLTRHS